MQVPTARMPVAPFHDPHCNGKTKFTLNVLQEGRKNIHIGCCTCKNKRMGELIELINKYCFDRSDLRQRFFFYEMMDMRDWINSDDLVEPRIHPRFRVLSVRVACVVEEGHSCDEHEILITTTPPLPPRGISPTWEDDACKTSPEGSDIEN